MSALGKVACVVVILCSAASAFLGFSIAKQRSGYGSQLSAVEDALRKTPNINYKSDYKLSSDEPAATMAKLASILSSTKEQLSTASAKLQETSSKLAEAESRSQQLTTEATSVKKDLESKTADLAQASSKLQEVQTKLKNYEDKLGGRDLTDILGDLKIKEEKAKVLDAEKKIIEDTLAKTTSELNKLKELQKLADDKRAPMDLSGKVVAINKAWNFVVLDVGKENKLVEGVDLAVYRGDALIGKIRTVSVDANTAIADILPDATKNEIQVGDKVLF